VTQSLSRPRRTGAERGRVGAEQQLVVHTLRDIAVTILLVLIEFGLVALILAPRAVKRGLKSLLRILVSSAKRVQALERARRGSPHPSREGT
jgi:hypothetical protein